MHFLTRNGWASHFAIVIVMISACLCFLPLSSAFGMDNGEASSINTQDDNTTVEAVQTLFTFQGKE